MIRIQNFIFILVSANVKIAMQCFEISQIPPPWLRACHSTMTGGSKPQ